MERSTQLQRQRQYRRGRLRYTHQSDIGDFMEMTCVHRKSVHGDRFRMSPNQNRERVISVQARLADGDRHLSSFSKQSLFSVFYRGSAQLCTDEGTRDDYDDYHGRTDNMGWSTILSC